MEVERYDGEERESKGRKIPNYKCGWVHELEKVLILNNVSKLSIVIIIIIGQEVGIKWCTLIHS